MGGKLTRETFVGGGRVTERAVVRRELLERGAVNGRSTVLLSHFLRTDRCILIKSRLNTEYKPKNISYKFQEDNATNKVFYCKGKFLTIPGRKKI